MEFVKVEALGNDFILIPENVEPKPASVMAWCARRTGIGADGVLTAHPGGANRVIMRYWNADGGEAEMCGNGLRCIARFAWESGWVDEPSFVVQSAVGEHPVEVSGDRVRAMVGRPHRFRTDTLSVAGREVHPVGIGNPHAVLFVDSVEEAPVETLGPRIERDPLFPGRTNVEFVEVLDGERIEVRVWERGVGETQASGTGATAAAFAAHDRGLVGSPVAVELRGGTLMVEFVDGEAWMEGPARTVFRGVLLDSA